MIINKNALIIPLSLEYDNFSATFFPCEFNVDNYISISFA